MTENNPIPLEDLRKWIEAHPAKAYAQAVITRLEEAAELDEILDRCDAETKALVPLMRRELLARRRRMNDAEARAGFLQERIRQLELQVSRLVAGKRVLEANETQLRRAADAQAEGLRRKINEHLAAWVALAESLGNLENWSAEAQPAVQEIAAYVRDVAPKQ